MCLKSETLRCIFQDGRGPLPPIHLRGICSSFGQSFASNSMNNIYLRAFCIWALAGVVVVRGAFLRSGNPLPWKSSLPFLKPVRMSGVQQFISHYERCKQVEMPLFLWGDEIESGIFARHADTGVVDLSIAAGVRTRDVLTQKESAVSACAKPRFPTVLDMFTRIFRLSPPSVDKNMASADKSTVNGIANGCEWQPEYGSWMIEAVPRHPYGGDTVSDLLNVQKSMQLRRKRLHSVLSANEMAPTTSNFPMMGVSGYPHTVHPATSLDEQVDELSMSNNNISESVYVSDALLNPHPRFGTLTANIRNRRGSKVSILVPVDLSPDEKYVPSELITSVDEKQDERQEERGSGAVRHCPQCDSTNLQCHTSPASASASCIHMDAMAFGMGCCCLQVTMQARSEDESRFLHDQLAVLSPILQALSAATPIFKGQLAATDTRWNVISQAVDDRTPAEQRSETDLMMDLESQRDSRLVGDGVRRLPQSRYSEVALFIAQAHSAAERASLAQLNDLSVPVDDETLALLLRHGVDEPLARHVAHLFARDPLVIFEDHIDLDDDKSQDHFENIQSTNWRSLRWKTPALEVGLQHHQEQQKNEKEQAKQREEDEKLEKPAHRSGETQNIALTSDHPSESNASSSLQQYGPGWRTEFRPLELQLTDFENSAYSLLVVLLSRCILRTGCSLYLPMSLVHENMRRAQLKDAVLSQKFWFRRNALDNLLVQGAADSKDYVSVHKEENPYRVPSLDELDIVELSIDQIMNGYQNESSDGLQKGFKGLLPMVQEYIKSTLLNTSESTPANHVNTSGVVEASSVTQHVNATPISEVHPLTPYMQLIAQRARGTLPTTARWIRNFVTSHPHYVPRSGVLTPTVANDLLQACEDIGMGRVQCPELYGRYAAPVVQNLDEICEQDLMFPKF